MGGSGRRRRLDSGGGHPGPDGIPPLINNGSNFALFPTEIQLRTSNQQTKQ